MATRRPEQAVDRVEHPHLVEAGDRESDAGPPGEPQQLVQREADPGGVDRIVRHRDQHVRDVEDGPDPEQRR